MGHLFPVLLFVISVIHLISCLMKQPNMVRRFTKPMLMPLLAFSYFYISDEARPLILLALLLGCAGDTLLLFPRQNTCFLCGGISFCAGHICYTFAFLSDANWKLPSPLLLILIVLIYGSVVFGVSFSLRKYIPKRYSFLAPMYLGFVALMSACALFRCMAKPGISIVTWVGSLFFLVSDSILLFDKFKWKTGRLAVRNFLIMFTYIVAQALIVVGMC